MIRGIVWRFLSDCRDFWRLITKGQPEEDPLLLWRLVAETAKIGIPSMDEIDRWEEEMFAKCGAWWFDPSRYDGTPFAWPERTNLSLSDYRQTAPHHDLQQAINYRNVLQQSALCHSQLMVNGRLSLMDPFGFKMF